MGRDAPTEEKRKQDDATLQIMSIHYSLYKTRNINKALVITGQNTTEILFKYIFFLFFFLQGRILLRKFSKKHNITL